MNIFIKKDVNEIKDFPENSILFSIDRYAERNVFTNFPKVLNRMEIKDINPIYEDLFTIGLSVFAVDKRIPRSCFDDNWTRELKVNIPVFEFDKWNNEVNRVNAMLRYLTGDKWDVAFRETEYSIFHDEIKRRKTNPLPQCDSVCLFSGGLDSFCGAIHLLKNGHSPCLVGHNEYPKLQKKQNELAEMFREEYPSLNAEFISFTAGSYAPKYVNGTLFNGSENTSRGRSLLFLCVALVMASVLGENIPVYIPENGFIGLNVPLTNSRKGSCTTRTTHPYFLNMFKEIINTVGINNDIINPFAHETKRNIVNSVKDEEAFKKGYLETISCSHPCNPRYYRTKRVEYPINCGYCYPCIIRKSSLLDVPDEAQRYDHNAINMSFINQNEGSDKVSDLNAVISTVYRYQHISDEELTRLIKSTGKLSLDEINIFKDVYKDSLNDIIELLYQDAKLKEYIEE